MGIRVWDDRVEVIVNASVPIGSIITLIDVERLTSRVPHSLAVRLKTLTEEYVGLRSGYEKQ